MLQRMSTRAARCRSLFLLLALCAGIVTAATQTLDAHVVKVVDGDSLEVRDSNGLVHRVRLAGIDAPEYSQPFGNRSRQALASLVLDKDVRLEIVKRDAYGRF